MRFFTFFPVFRAYFSEKVVIQQLYFIWFIEANKKFLLRTGTDNRSKLLITLPRRPHGSPGKT